MDNIKPGNCAVCKQKISGKTMTCPRCETPHHADCWDYSGNKCSVFGCDKKMDTRPPRPTPAETNRSVVPFSIIYILFSLTFLLLFMTTLTNCDSRKKANPPMAIVEKIENISGLSMLGYGDYFINYSDDSNPTEVKRRLLPGGDWRISYIGCHEKFEIRVFKDVAVGQKMWVLIASDPPSCDPRCPHIVEIHIRSLDDIKDAGRVRDSL